MLHTMSRVISLVAFTLFAIHAHSQMPDFVETSGECGSGLTWEFDEDTGVLTITGNGPMTNFTSRYMGPERVEKDGEEVVLTSRQKARIRHREAKKRARQRRRGQYDNSVDFDHLIPWRDLHSLIKRVSVSEGVTTIGDNAFKGCEELRSVSLPNSIEIIGRECFYWCVKLDSITIPSGVNVISLGAFSGCYTMKSITFSRRVVKIENSAFYQCNGLRRVDYSGSLSDWLAIDFISENSNPLKYAGNLYLSGVPVDEVVLPDTMTVVPPYVCMGMVNIHRLTIPPSVVKIGSHAFDGCRSLSTVEALPVTAPILGKYVFLNTSIKQILVPYPSTKDQYRLNWGKRYNYQNIHPEDPPEGNFQEK